MTAMCMILLSGCGTDNVTGESNGSSSETVKLKLGTKMPADNPEGKAFQKFAELVKEKSDGSIIVDVYPSEQLGKGTTQINNMLSGNQDMYAEDAVYFSDYDNRLQLSAIPFLFRDFEHFQKFNTGPIGEEINQNLIEQNIRILNTKRNFQRGPNRVLLSKEPVKNLKDVKDLQLRSFESKTYSDAWKHLGASPTTVAWTETYLALKQGTVDAVVSPSSLVSSMNFAEVAPNMTMIDEYPQDIVLTINNEKYESLSEEQQKILTEAANEAGEIGTKLAKDASEEMIENLTEEEGLKTFEINKEKWTNEMKPFFESLEDGGTLPEDIVDEIMSIE